MYIVKYQDWGEKHWTETYRIFQTFDDAKAAVVRDAQAFVDNACYEPGEEIPGYWQTLSDQKKFPADEAPEEYEPLSYVIERPWGDADTWRIIQDRTSEECCKGAVVDWRKIKDGWVPAG